jgi:ssDNA-binding Zn-finger/Zn-ribbon topoisomerase 1
MPPNVTRPGSFIRYIKSKSDVVLSDEDIEAVLEKLQIGKATTAISNSTHVENLKANAIQPKCPQCDTDMILRRVKKGAKVGSEFWGCVNFPKCRIVKNIA